MIRPIRRGDIKECVTLYNRYITETTATFELEPLTEEAFAARVETLCRTYPYLVCEDDDGHVVGYAYLSPYAERAAYRFTCDISIYLAMDERGKGYGRLLYEALEAEAYRRGFFSIVAVVTGENTASMAFHERMGYALMAEFPRMGFKFDRWLSVRYYRKMLRDPEKDKPREVLSSEAPYLLEC